MKDEKQKWTKGKTNIVHEFNIVSENGRLIANCGGHSSRSETSYHENLGNTQRFNDLWNEFSDIPDPQEFVEAAKDLFEYAQALRECVTPEELWDMFQDDNNQNFITRFEKALGKDVGNLKNNNADDTDEPFDFADTEPDSDSGW